MKRCREDLFIWPTDVDDSWEDLTAIICKLNPPQLMNKREQFAFSSTDIKKVEALTSKRIY